MVVLEQICKHGHRKLWCSQPTQGNMPQGNLQLVAAILFSGCSPVKVLKCFRHFNILTIGYRTFNIIQRSYLVPAVFHVWRTEQEHLFHLIRQSGEKIILGGDARCDSPGHNAKYGSYVVMDLKNNKILDVQLVQCNEVTTSNAMELEGLKHCFQKLDDNNIEVDTLVTDRHPSVQKYMKTMRPLIKHCYDCWHIAKSVYKKIIALTKKAGYTSLKNRAHSISNHLYWCPSSSNGHSDFVKTKWTSISNHIVNIHKNHSDLFPQCLHDNLEDREWLKKGSRAHKGLIQIISAKRLLHDIGKMSPSEQTSSLESYHRTVCLFAPKLMHFFYPSMRARTLLAALHFNENSSRPQAVSKDGHAQWSVSYPKYKDGGTIKEIKVKCTLIILKN